MEVGKRLERAKHIQRTLGVRVAAGFLRNKGMSLEAALWWLLGKAVRDYETRLRAG